MANLATFRDDVRGWLDENCPQSMRTPMVASEYPGGGRRAAYENPETKLWLDRCADRGYTAPMWPSEFVVCVRHSRCLGVKCGRLTALV